MPCVQHQELISFQELNSEWLRVSGARHVGRNLVVTKNTGMVSATDDTVGQDLIARGTKGPGLLLRDDEVTRDTIVLGNAAPVVVDSLTAGHYLSVRSNRPGGATIDDNHAGAASCVNNDPQSGSGNVATHVNTCPA